MRVLVRTATGGFLVTGLLFGAIQGLGVQLAGAHARPVAAPQRIGHLVYRGTVNLRSLAAASQRSRRSLSPTRPTVGRPPLRHLRSLASTSVPVPNPATTPIAPGTGGAQGFGGLTAADSGSLNGFDVEPPDQGMCAHGGAVLEGVNLAVKVYTESGVALTPTVSLNDFFGMPPAVSSHNPPTFGPFLSDPKCYYDVQTGRWFVTALEIDVNPYSGALAYRSSELIAVSQTSDPTGVYALFSFDTTNDGSAGTPSEPNCPCFGDQPRIGADAHGFYISTDSYPIHGVFNSNGGEIYAISKQGLAAAASGTGPGPTLVAIHNGGVTIDGFPANAVQPAETPQGAAYAPNKEYFLNTPDFNGFATMGGTGAEAVVLWTLSNTASLSSPSPSVTLSHAIVPSEPFAPPVNAAQKAGPRPLGESVKAPLPRLSVNDDRMQQVEYVGGKVYSSLNTGIGAKGAANRSGVAWFQVTPSGTTGTMTHQGYVALTGVNTLLYPSIGLSDRTGVMTFSVSGPTILPKRGVHAVRCSGPWRSDLPDRRWSQARGWVHLLCGHGLRSGLPLGGLHGGQRRWQSSGHG